MPIQVQQFPILNAGQMNPFHQALQTGLDVYSKGLGAAYARPNLQADLDKKEAYVDYMRNMPSQYLSSVLSNPALTPYLSNEQRDQMVNSIIQRSQPRQAQQEEKGGLWDWAKNLMGATSEQNPSAVDNQYIPAMKPGESYVGASGRPPEQQNITPQPVNDMGMPTQNMGYESGANSAPLIQATDAAANAANRDFGSPSANMYQAAHNPSPAFKMQQEVQTAKQRSKVVAEEKISAKKRQELNDDASLATQQATDLSKKLDTFKRVYDESKLTGPILGKLVQFGPKSAELNQVATEMQTEVAAQLFGNRITNYKEQLGGKVKLNPEMPAQTVHSVYERMKLGAERIKEYESFVNNLQDRGITNPNKIKKMWNDYNIDMPFYSDKEGKALSQNIGQYDKYINSSLSGKPIKSTTPVKDSSVASSPGVKTVEHGGKKYIHINGKWMPA